MKHIRIVNKVFPEEIKAIIETSSDDETEEDLIRECFEIKLQDKFYNDFNDLNDDEDF